MLIPAGGRLQADRQAAGRRHRDRSGAHRHPDAAQASAWSASSSSSSATAWSTCRWPTAPPSPTWRRNTARPAAFFPIDAESLTYLRLSGRDEDQIALVESLRQGAGALAPPGQPEANTAPPCTWTWPRAAVAGRPEAPAGSRAAEDMKAGNFTATWPADRQPQAEGRLRRGRIQGRRRRAAAGPPPGRQTDFQNRRSRIRTRTWATARW